MFKYVRGGIVVNTHNFTSIYYKLCHMNHSKFVEECTISVSYIK